MTLLGSISLSVGGDPEPLLSLTQKHPSLRSVWRDEA